MTEPETTDFSSDEIAASADELSKGPEPASSAAQPEKPAAKADASTKETPAESQKKADEFGPVPWERHEAILNKTRRDLEGKLSGLSWAEQLKADEVREALDLREQFRRDPAAFAKATLDRAKTSEKPQPDLQTEDGRKMFSDVQAEALADFKVQQAIAAFEARLEPRLKPFEKERQAIEANRQLQQDVARVADLPKFGDYLTDMTAFMVDYNKRISDGERLPVLSARDVYDRVVLPKLASRDEELIAKGRQAALDDLDKSTSRSKGDLNPAKRAQATRVRDEDKDWEELIEETVAAHK